MSTVIFNSCLSYSSSQEVVRFPFILASGGFLLRKSFFPCVIPIMTTFNDPIPFQSDEK